MIATIIKSNTIKINTIKILNELITTISILLITLGSFTELQVSVTFPVPTTSKESPDTLIMLSSDVDHFNSLYVLLLGSIVQSILNFFVLRMSIKFPAKYGISEFFIVIFSIGL